MWDCVYLRVIACGNEEVWKHWSFFIEPDCCSSVLVLRKLYRDCRISLLVAKGKHHLGEIILPEFSLFRLIDR